MRNNSFMQVMLAVSAFVAITMSVMPVNAQDKPIVEGYIGIGMPSGDNFSNQYGGIMIDLGVKAAFAKSETMAHSIFVGVTGAFKEADFMANNVGGGTSAAIAASRANVIAIGYEATTIPGVDSSLYLGAGAAVGIVNNNIEYDAGENWIWVINGEQKYSVKNSQVIFTPHVLVGYKINEKSAIEAKYRLIGADLPATDSAFSKSYPSIQNSKLSGILSLTYNGKF